MSFFFYQFYAFLAYPTPNRR